MKNLKKALLIVLSLPTFVACDRGTNAPDEDSERTLGSNLCGEIYQAKALNKDGGEIIRIKMDDGRLYDLSTRYGSIQDEMDELGFPDDSARACIRGMMVESNGTSYMDLIDLDLGEATVHPERPEETLYAKTYCGEIDEDLKLDTGNEVIEITTPSSDLIEELEAAAPSLGCIYTNHALGELSNGNKQSLINDANFGW